MPVKITSDMAQQILEADKVSLSFLFWIPIILLAISIIARIIIYFVCKYNYSYMAESIGDIAIGCCIAIVFIFSIVSGFELYRLNNYPELYIMDNYVTNNNVYIVEKK